jgi:hypothetical protein
MPITGKKKGTKKTGPEKYIVRGTVQEKDGIPLTIGKVRLFHKEFRTREIQLGPECPVKSGQYEIGYTVKDIPGTEQRPNLFVRAYDEKDNAIATSEDHIVFNAEPETTIDLVIDPARYRRPAEYARLIDTLTKYVKSDKLADLDKKEVVFLAGKTGEDRLRISNMVAAQRLSRKIKIPAEILYGLICQRQPTDVAAFLAQDPDTQIHALEAAVKENIIPAGFGTKDEIQKFTELRIHAIVNRAFEKPETKGKYSVGELLSTVLKGKKLQSEFLRLYTSHSGTIETFWKELQKNPKFKGKADDLHFALFLGALTNNHLPLVQEIQRLKQEGYAFNKDRKISSLQDLTLLNEKCWEEIIDRGTVGVPPDIHGTSPEEKTRNYARVITRVLEETFPAAFITNRIAEDTNFEGREDLQTFLKNNPDFDITSTHLKAYLKKKQSAIPADKDANKLTATIKTMQRVYAVTRNYNDMRLLIDAGLNSAHAISRMGKNLFSTRFGKKLSGWKDARLMYEEASQKSATALNLLVTYCVKSLKTSTHSVPNNDTAQLSQISDWPTLFGALELCECEHCRSVCSPAAYLVDILHYIGEIAADPEEGLVNPDAMKVKEILCKRRPDIGSIELTCENTNTQVPYIDLTNEVLENAVSQSKFDSFSMTPDVIQNLNECNISPGSALFNEFSANLIRLSLPALSSPVVTVKIKDSWWTIEDRRFTYTARIENGFPTVIARSLQTSGTAEERAANPQYLNPDAYEILKIQVYPWTLPFNLWTEEARAYLGHLGIKRYELMEMFSDLEDRQAILAATDIGREYLGLTTEEAGIINGSITGQPDFQPSSNYGIWNLWGFITDDIRPNPIPDPANSTAWISDTQDPNNSSNRSSNWLDVLTSRVDVFLQQSGLTYLELLAMLDTNYINGSQNIRIIPRPKDSQNQDTCEPDTCELCCLQLSGFSEEHAKKTVRFVRLWRKLGWSMRELDLAFTVLYPRDSNSNLLTRNTDIDQFVVRLSHVRRLHDRLKIPVDRLLSFWAPDDQMTGFWSRTYRDYHAEGQPVIPALFTKIFCNRSVSNPPDPSFAENPVNLDATKSLAYYSATITATLGITSDEFDAMVQDQEAGIIPTKAAPESLGNTVPDDAVTLQNLSRLHRHTTLAKSLKIPIREYISLLKIIGHDSSASPVGIILPCDPFTTTADTIIFTEKVKKIRSSGFKIAELDYLLRHEFSPGSSFVPTDKEIGRVLDEIRSGLQTIAAENTFISDPTNPNGVTTDLNGDLTRKKLALLDWDAGLIEDVVATLSDAVTYEFTLDVPLSDDVRLPNDTGKYSTSLVIPSDTLTIPEGLKDVLRYDGNNLIATRILTQPEQALLHTTQVSTDYASVFLNAVEDLLKQQDEMQGMVTYEPATRKIGNDLVKS